MPLTRNGVSFTDAYLEAAAIARVDTAMLSAFELDHPALPDGPLRFVNDTQSLSATLEADAPVDPGADVLFLACPVRVQPPEESDQASAPDIQIQVDNVSGGFNRALNIARGSLAPWTLRERIYAETDTSGPAQLPPKMVEVDASEINSTTVTLTCSFGDPGNLRVPALSYIRSEYPGLDR